MPKAGVAETPLRGRGGMRSEMGPLRGSHIYPYLRYFSELPLLTGEKVGEAFPYFY